MGIKIAHLTARDIRFPTSRALDGSDAMNPDPDYSATYVILHTDSPAFVFLDACHGLRILGLGRATMQRSSRKEPSARITC